MTENLTSLHATAKKYCDTIDSIGDGNPDWLMQISQILSTLHASIVADMNNSNSKNGYTDPNLEVRFELFSKLRSILGDKDAYWMEFDLAHGDEHKSGSLADDLTDIYCELKRGLMRLESQEDPNNVQLDWLSGHRIHWGKHLLDAQKHLFELSAQNELLVG